MNTQRFSKAIAYFVLLTSVLVSCTSTATVAPTDMATPSITPLPTDTFIPTPTPTPNRVRDFALSPDGSKIAVYEKDGIFIYDTFTSEKTVLSSGTCTNCGCESSGVVAFSPDGTKIAASSSYLNNFVEVTDIATGKLLWSTYDIPNGHCVTEIEFSPESSTIFVRSSYPLTMRCEFPEDILELYSLSRTSDFSFESRILQMRWCRYNPGRIKFLSDGRFYIFLGSLGNSYWVSVGDSKTGQIIEQHEYDITKDGWFYDISQDGQVLATSDSTNVFENFGTSIIDSTSKEVLTVVPYFVMLLRDKTEFLVQDNSQDWKYRHWKLWKNDEIVCTYDGTYGSKMKFSVNGNFLAAQESETSLQIWKISTCEKINTISVSE